MVEGSWVKNAADEAQVKDAERLQRFTRRDELDDLRALLQLPAFRRFLWKLLAQCQVFKSIFHASALIHYNAGMQDVGHYLLSELQEARADALILLLQE